MRLRFPKSAAVQCGNALVWVKGSEFLESSERRALGFQVRKGLLRVEICLSEEEYLKTGKLRLETKLCLHYPVTSHQQSYTWMAHAMQGTSCQPRSENYFAFVRKGLRDVCVVATDQYATPHLRGLFLGKPFEMVIYPQIG